MSAEPFCLISFHIEEQTTSKGNVTKLEDVILVTGDFVHEINHYYQHWIHNKN